MTMAQDAEQARAVLRGVDTFANELRLGEAAVYALLELADAIRSLGGK